MRYRTLGLLLIAHATLLASRASADSKEGKSGIERPAVVKGVEFLKTKVNGMNSGEAALAALAMIKAEVPLNDPALAACVAKFGANFNGTTYTPETSKGPEIYEAAVAILAMVNIDPAGYKTYIDAASQYILSKQMSNGAWDYSNRTFGDTSISQYAILALWEAENAGIMVQANVWDRAAKWYLSVQSSQGSWNYHRDEPTWPETLSMSAAGLGTLLICQKQLARHRKGQDLINPLMTPLVIDGQAADARYKVETSAASINNGIRNGLSWLGGNFQVSTSEIMGQSPYYCLYGIERTGALADKGALGGIDWYSRGLQFCLSTQKPDGSWNAQHNDVPNTCWAILFSTRSTEKSIHKIAIRRLGAGTLLGGRGLPTNLENVEMVQGKLVVKPMGGAVEGMLAALEDPKSQNADAALAGLVAKYQTDGPKVLKAQKDRFRRFLNDRDPGLRKVATWGLGRTGDLDVAPALIRSLLDADDDVVNEAKLGLQVLSRKLDGFGPVKGASLDERKAAARRWQDWFESVRPPDLDAPDELPTLSSEKATTTTP